MVKKTPNHGLNKYAEGEADWTHSPDMQAIEERLVIRDQEEKIGDYIPYSTATFISTDTGRTYDGDGESWQPAARGFGTVSASTIDAGRTLRDPSGKEITTEIATIDQTGGNGVETLLQQGMIVGVTSSNTYLANPRDFGSHDAAIQNAVSQLQNGSEPGYVYIPAIPSDNSNITIENTVTFDGNSGPNVLPMGYGFLSQDCAYIDTTIDDGSPMFQLEDMRAQRTPFGGLKASAPGQDAEFIRMTNVIEPYLRDCEARGLGTDNPSAEGAYVIDSHCYNGLVLNCAYNQRGGDGENPSVGGMNAFAARDSRGTDGPGEMQFVGLNTYADTGNPFRAGYHSTTNASNMMFAFGRFEGAQEAHFDIDSQGALSVGAPFQMGRTENGGHGIDFRGFKLTVSTGVWSGGTIDGDGIRFEPGRGMIGFVHLHCNGDDVKVTANPGGSNRVTVPDPDALLGTASYPSGASNVRVINTNTPS